MLLVCIRWLIRSNTPMMLLIDHTCFINCTTACKETSWKIFRIEVFFSEVQSMINISIFLLYLIFWLLNIDNIVFRYIWRKWKFYLCDYQVYVNRWWYVTYSIFLLLSQRIGFSFSIEYYHSIVKCDEICIYTVCSMGL